MLKSLSAAMAIAFSFIAIVDGVNGRRSEMQCNTNCTVQKSDRFVPKKPAANPIEIPSWRRANYFCQEATFHLQLCLGPEARIG